MAQQRRVSLALEYGRSGSGTNKKKSMTGFHCGISSEQDNRGLRKREVKLDMDPAEKTQKGVYNVKGEAGRNREGVAKVRQKGSVLRKRSIGRTSIME